MSITHAVATKSAKSEATASRNHKNAQAVPEVIPGMQTGFSGEQFLVQRKKNSCACGGGCPRCALQAKRTISEYTESPVQRQAEPEEETVEEVPLQGKFNSADSPAQPQADSGEVANHTSMPGRLKSGLEALSGMDLSGVSVHRNSAKPAQVDALAYTQGQDIHVSPGQEKHLPHEGWHVVQQMQGRVKPTMQKKGVSINDDLGLEHEADVMGAKAEGMAQSDHSGYLKIQSGNDSGAEVGRPRPTLSGTTQSMAVQMFNSVDEHKKQGDIGGDNREYIWDVESAKNGGPKELTVHETTPYKRGTRLGPDEWAHRLDRPGQAITDPDYWTLKAGEVEFRLTHGDLNMLSGDYFDPRNVDENGKPITRDVDEKGEAIPPNFKGVLRFTIPDSLFSLASTPSQNPGKVLGTQDEIIYALYLTNPSDPRFSSRATKEHPGGGIWWPLINQFSDEVKSSVKNRYFRLASINFDHFVAPAGKANINGGARPSVGGAYRFLHEDAIWRARVAGGQNKDIGEAMAREAAAQHFLADGFASGHIRTPRKSIKDYWSQKYPHFFNNFKKRIALSMAMAMNKQRFDLMRITPVTILYGEVRKAIDEQAKDFPEISFGTLVSLVIHDFENKEGLMVLNDLGDRWKAYGDGSLETKDKDNRTAEMIQKAIHFGIQDIENAYLWGIVHGNPSASGPALDNLMKEATKNKAGNGTDISESLQRISLRTKKDKGPDTAIEALIKKDSLETVFENVRKYPPKGAKANSDKYAPEQVLPNVNPKVEKSKQAWKADSLEDLAKLRVVRRSSRSDGKLPSSPTWKTVLKEAMKNDGEIYKKLKEIGDGIDKQSTIPVSIKRLEIDGSLPWWVGNMKPQQAYINGFLKPMQADPLVGLQKIIDFNPADGVFFPSASDVVMADLKEMHGGNVKDVPKSEDHMSGLTLNQRVSRVNILASGLLAQKDLGFSLKNEMSMIVELFKTATPADRVTLYERVKISRVLRRGSYWRRVMKLINER